MRIAGGFLIINSETRFLRFLIINSESGFPAILILKTKEDKVLYVNKRTSV
jgi:hypothetical protein